jgi:hypothetical protein
VSQRMSPAERARRSISALSTVTRWRWSALWSLACDARVAGISYCPTSFRQLEQTSNNLSRFQASR